MDEGVRIFGSACNAQALLERQPARDKRGPLDFALSKGVRKHGEVIATFHQPFDPLHETMATAAAATTANPAIALTGR
ncbi:MAG: hypothetical protein CVT84_05520 [Alphaproteobacteria bacterium HGW-Alphaproteobacteria-6]|nr:MAG: hypothetical protein CVT84_05520 [Alphaproteobacteria bacterium HGW-Alphaproteobacteria-6]